MGTNIMRQVNPVEVVVELLGMTSKLSWYQQREVVRHFGKVCRELSLLQLKETSLREIKDEQNLWEPTLTRQSWFFRYRYKNKLRVIQENLISFAKVVPDLFAYFQVLLNQENPDTPQYLVASYLSNKLLDSTPEPEPHPEKCLCVICRAH